jgi:hypothetical protein
MCCTEKNIPSNVEGKPSLPFSLKLFPSFPMFPSKFLRYRFSHPRSEGKLPENEGIHSHAFPLHLRVCPEQASSVFFLDLFFLE